MKVRKDKSNLQNVKNSPGGFSNGTSTLWRPAASVWYIAVALSQRMRCWASTRPNTRDIKQYVYNMKVKNRTSKSYWMNKVPFFADYCNLHLNRHKKSKYEMTVTKIKITVKHLNS